MSLVYQIIEESHQFRWNFGRHPDFVFIGRKQAKEMDDIAAELEKVGLMVADATLPPRAKFNGMDVYRVDDDDFLSLGANWRLLSTR